MLSLIITLAIYTVIVLFFVPLEKIGKLQTKVQVTVRKWINKLKD